MEVRRTGRLNFYRCGMISLLMIPILFFAELKTNQRFAPQYGLVHRELNGPDSTRRINYEPFDYFSDYSSVKKRDTILISQPVDREKMDPLFNLKSGNSLCFSFSDNVSYGDYILIYHSALKHHLSVYFTDNTSLLVFNPKDRTARITPHPLELEWFSLEGDILPTLTLWTALKEMVESHFIRYMKYLIHIDLFYPVLAISMGYIMIVILAMRELKRIKRVF